MNGLVINGVSLGPGVIETIASIAAKEVDGVIGLAPAHPESKILGFFKKPQEADSVSVELDDDESLSIGLHVIVSSNVVLPEVADKVRKSVAEAVATQVGADIKSVDVYIDEVKFD